MKEKVEQAIAELGAAGLGSAIEIKEDPDGGAYVILEGLKIGEVWNPIESWIGFHITFPYPDADVYPHFTAAGLRYIGEGETPNQSPDGDLPMAMTRGATMPG